MKKLRRINIIIIITLLILILISLLILRGKNKQEEITSSVSESTIEMYNTKLITSVTNPEKLIYLEPQLPTYLLTTTSQTDFLEPIINKLALERHPKAENIWLNSQTGNSLIIDQFSEKITISWNYPQPKNKGIDSQAALKVVDQILTDLNLTSFSPNQENSKYILGNSAEFEDLDNIKSNPPSKSDIIIIPLEYKPKPIKMIMGNIPHNEPRISINSDSNPVSLTFFNPPPAINPGVNITAPNKYDIVTKINNGDFILNSSSIKPDEEINQAALTIDHNELEYRLDQQTKIAYPYLYINGLLNNKHKISISVPLLN